MKKRECPSDGCSDVEKKRGYRPLGPAEERVKEQGEAAPMKGDADSDEEGDEQW